jgi:hypothetical protein
MVRFAVAFILFAGAACTRGEPPLLIDGGERAQSPTVSEAVKAAVRAEAQRRHGAACGTVTLPDRAFVPLGNTGGPGPDFAVLFEDAGCPRNATNWQNTGGTLTQFWTASGQRPQLLLEQHTYGFTPRPNGFDSLQHQNDCGSASTSLCVVSYRWQSGENAPKIANRRNLIPGSKMQWDYRRPQ